MKNPAANLYRLLKSPALAVLLLLALAVLATIGTFASSGGEAQTGDLGKTGPLVRAIGLQNTFSSPLFMVLVALVTANVTACTWHRFARRWPPAGTRQRRLVDLILHGSLVLILVGGAVKGLTGFVGTQNIYVGGETQTVYDWRARQDTPLGFTIRIEEWEERYYPIRARIGLRRSATGEKLGLLEIVEGKDAQGRAGDLRLRIAGYDPAAGEIRLEEDAPGSSREMVFKTRDGGDSIVKIRGYDLSLVAFRADLKKIRARLSLRESGRVVADGWLDANSNLRHRGMSLFLTAWGTDDGGNRFCGIQAVRDPGAPLFWAGCALLALAMPLHLILKGRRPQGAPTEGVLLHDRTDQAGTGPLTPACRRVPPASPEADPRAPDR